MANVIKLRKGLNIHLKGTAAQTKRVVGACTGYVVRPDTFEGVVPKLVVHEGDRVDVGDALFVDKNFPEVKFASPVSGTVKAVDRGERRKILGIRLQADEVQKYHDFGRRDVSALSADEVRNALLEAGLFGYIYQLPYAVSTNPQAMPKAIFVSALRDMPLANNFEYELQGNERDFQTGLTALSKMATTYLGIGKNQKADALVNAKDVEVTVFDGPCPAGNVGVQVNHISPVNKGEVVWTVDPTFVIFFGRLFNTGKVNLLRTIALGGSAMATPMYVDALIGTPFSVILKDALTRQEDLRLINGNPLTGTKSCLRQRWRKNIRDNSHSRRCRCKRNVWLDNAAHQSVFHIAQLFLLAYGQEGVRFGCTREGRRTSYYHEWRIRQCIADGYLRRVPHQSHYRWRHRQDGTAGHLRGFARRFRIGRVR